MKPWRKQTTTTKIFFLSTTQKPAKFENMRYQKFLNDPPKFLSNYAGRSAAIGLALENLATLNVASLVRLNTETSCWEYHCIAWFRMQDNELHCIMQGLHLLAIKHSAWGRRSRFNVIKVDWTNTTTLFDAFQKSTREFNFHVICWPNATGLTLHVSRIELRGRYTCFPPPSFQSCSFGLATITSV